MSNRRSSYSIEKFGPKPVSKFWPNTKKVFFGLSLFSIFMFIFTLPSVRKTGVYSEIIGFAKFLLSMNEVFLISMLVMCSTFAILVYTRKNKVPHDEFVWELAKNMVGCEEAWYDPEFLYVKFDRSLNSHSIENFVNVINRRSTQYKYELNEIDKDLSLFVLQPIKNLRYKGSVIEKKAKKVTEIKN